MQNVMELILAGISMEILTCAEMLSFSGVHATLSNLKKPIKLSVCACARCFTTTCM